MSGRDKQRDDEEVEITAQPKSMREELAMQVGHEQGLSVDPEDLGRTWLSDATEQGNFESARGGDNDDLLSSDEALPGPNFEVDHDVWENTVSLTMQNGEGAISDPFVEDEDSASDDGLHASAGRDSGEIDLTQSSVQEASLFDHEAEELGETEQPRTVITEYSHMHAMHPEAPISASPGTSTGAGSAPKVAPSTAKSSAPRAPAGKPAPAAKAAGGGKASAAKAGKTIKPPPSKKAAPAKASKPKAARSSAPRAR